MKQRSRILLCLEASDKPLDSYAIDAATGSGKKRSHQTVRAWLSVLKARELIEVAGAIGKRATYQLTPKGQAEADRTQRDQALPGKPLRLQTKAVDGRAPRHLVNSVFSLAEGGVMGGVRHGGFIHTQIEEGSSHV